MTQNIDIIYGSTTGNTQDLAHTIELKLKSPSIITTCKSVLDITSGYTLNNNLNIWCCSTWGIEPPCLQEDFEEFINNKLQLASVQNKNFLIIGLGDSYYPHFAASVDILTNFITNNKGNVILQGLKLQDPWENELTKLDNLLLSFIKQYLQK